VLRNNASGNNYQIALHAVYLRDTRQNAPTLKAELLEQAQVISSRMRLVLGGIDLWHFQLFCAIPLSRRPKLNRIVSLFCLSIRWALPCF